MSSNLTLALRTVKSGLQVNQIALNTVANNVSNVNTPGYSRKIVNLEQRVLAGTGAGVQLARLTRNIDEGLLKSLRIELSKLSAIDVQETFHARVQDLFGKPEDDGSMAHTIARFAGALDSLALNPQNSLEQREVVRWGHEIAVQFRQMTATVQDLRLQADVQIGQAVDEINSLIAEVASLNDRIVRNEAVSHDATDLKDRRDLALDRLAELIDIRIFTRGDGDVVVFTTSGRTLVDSVSATLSHATAANLSATTTHAEGDLGGLYVGAQIATNDITGEIRGGELQGLIQLRDKVLTDLQSSLDELAAEIRDAINQVHNRGVAFPGLQQMSGTRTFVEPLVQTITFAGTADTRLVLFDSDGNQVRTNTLRNLLPLAGVGDSVDEVAAAIDAFLGADGSAAIVDGRLTIDVSSAGYHLAIRDEDATATPGSGRQDAAIEFDADGGGSSDERVEGFSHFFGLNDFFVDDLADNIHESNVLTSAFRATAATLTVRNAGGLLGTVAIAGGATLADVADAINAAALGVSATLVPDGSGHRLRLAADDGGSITVTDGGADTLLADLGMHVADVRVAGTIAVRADILNAPSRVATAAVQWDPGAGVAGEYFVSIGDDTVIGELAATFGRANAFDAAGGLGAMTVSFSRYAAAAIADQASLADLNRTSIAFQRSLVESLSNKSDAVRAVNLDEEMAALILYEQAYAASARVITIIQNMFDALEGAVS